ncbi:MAG: choice-of-anchor Q domain-containing protein [Labilibaculum antarcticum]
MHFYRLLFIILLSFVVISCDEDEHFTTDPNFRLTFSSDTIAFDTLFTGFASTTQQLKVKNTSADAISISHLYLQNSESPYRLNVNGIQSNNLMDVVLDAKDSLFIFIEVGLDPRDEDAPRLLADQLKFELNGQSQEVILETFAQDVLVIDADVSENTIWTGDRPYLLTESIFLADGVDLIVNEGARVYFKKNTALHIKGNLEVHGSFQRPVYFGSSRLEELYDNVPGQWDGIYFYDESTTTFLSHFTVENGINGLNFTKTILNNNPIIIEYGIIQNFTRKGLFASNSTIAAHDLLITNCGEECVRIEDASCTISHSTFYNSWFFTPRSSALISYQGVGENTFTINNSIVYGTRTDELELESLLNVSIDNSLLKIGSSAQTNYSSVFTNCLFNEDPDFLNLKEFNFALNAESPAVNNGNIEFVSTYLFDLAGNRRDSDIAPDMGCFEFSEIE